ncbi:hypothetical protein CPC08DRAFT_152097 [Agrocybe pediades]|nr:hypothetical protein CPC08DRAFT_152097 [Agrocybe pediades]
MPMTAPQFHGCAVLNTYDPGRRRIYELIVRQEPKQARMCGVGGKGGHQFAIATIPLLLHCDLFIFHYTLTYIIADRRPIDPPPIVQLRVIDPALQQGSSGSRHRRTSGSISSPPGSPRGHHDDAMAVDAGNCTQNYLQNPYYFMFASLARPDDDNELHWLKDGRTRCTTGSVVSSLYHLKDPQHNNEDAGFFVFPDLSVRTEGSYRLKLSLFEVVK